MRERERACEICEAAGLYELFAETHFNCKPIFICVQENFQRNKLIVTILTLHEPVLRCFTFLLFFFENASKISCR